MKNLNYYLELPYTTVLRRDEEGDYVARIDELPGCSAHGKTQGEALENLREAEELWIQDCIDSGHPVPEPVLEEALPSGKWVQRVPRSLHKKLTALARQEGTSLNQLVTSALAETVGARWDRPAREAESEPGDQPTDPWATQVGRLSFSEATAGPGTWVPDIVGLCAGAGFSDLTLRTRAALLAMFERLGKGPARPRGSQPRAKRHPHEEAYKIC